MGTMTPIRQTAYVQKATDENMLHYTGPDIVTTHLPQLGSATILTTVAISYTSVLEGLRWLELIIALLLYATCY